MRLKRFSRCVPGSTKVKTMTQFKGDRIRSPLFETLNVTIAQVFVAG